MIRYDADLEAHKWRVVYRTDLEYLENNPGGWARMVEGKAVELIRRHISQPDRINQIRDDLFIRDYTPTMDNYLAIFADLNTVLDALPKPDPVDAPAITFRVNRISVQHDKNDVLYYLCSGDFFKHAEIDEPHDIQRLIALVPALANKGLGEVVEKPDHLMVTCREEGKLILVESIYRDELTDAEDAFVATLSDEFAPVSGDKFVMAKDLVRRGWVGINDRIIVNGVSMVGFKKLSEGNMAAMTGTKLSDDVAALRTVFKAGLDKRHIKAMGAPTLDDALGTSPLEFAKRPVKEGETVIGNGTAAIEIFFNAYDKKVMDRQTAQVIADGNFQKEWDATDPARTDPTLERLREETAALADHWIDVKHERAAFWADVNGAGAVYDFWKNMSQPDRQDFARRACKVEKMHEFKGTRSEASQVVIAEIIKEGERIPETPARPTLQNAPKSNQKAENSHEAKLAGQPSTETPNSPILPISQNQENNPMQEAAFVLLMNLYAPNGAEMKFTLRAMTAEELGTRIDDLIAVFSKRGYTATRPTPAAQPGNISQFPDQPAHANGGKVACVMIKVEASYGGGKPQLQFECDGMDNTLKFTRQASDMVKLLANIRKSDGTPFTANDFTIGRKFAGNWAVQWSTSEKDGKTFRNVDAVSAA